MPNWNRIGEIAKLAASEAARLLEKRPLGGLKAESATKALEHATQKVASEADGYIGELLTRGRQADTKIVEQSTLIKGLNSKNADLESRQMELMRKLKHPESKRVTDGKVTIIRTNKNGAVLEKEMTPDGKVASYKVTTSAGVRKGTFKDGVRQSTISRTDKTFGTKYDNNGKTAETKELNTKKVVDKGEGKITQERIDTSDYGFAGTSEVTTRTYKDGSKTVKIVPLTSTNLNIKEVYQVYDKNGAQIKMETIYSNGGKRLERFNPETKEVKYRLDNTPYGTIESKFQTVQDGINKRTNYTIKDKTFTYQRTFKKDKMGLYNDLEDKVTYPQDSPVNYAVAEKSVGTKDPWGNEESQLTKVTFYMKDGRKIEGCPYKINANSSTDMFYAGAKAFDKDGKLIKQYAGENDYDNLYIALGMDINQHNYEQIDAFVEPLFKKIRR